MSFFTREVPRGEGFWRRRTRRPSDCRRGPRGKRDRVLFNGVPSSLGGGGAVQELRSERRGEWPREKKKSSMSP